jgi:hypothetical protein
LKPTYWTFMLSFIRALSLQPGETFYGFSETCIVVTGRRDVCLAAQKPPPLGNAAEGV